MNKPTYTCFNIRPRGEGRRPSWMPIGSGRVNKDGSFNLTFDALPLDGKVNVRVRKEKVADQAETA